MSSVTLRRGLLVLALAVPLFAPATLRAQRSGTMSADDVALRGYTLTLANLQKLKQSMVNLKAYIKTHPDAADEMGDSDDDGNATLEQSISRISAVTPIKQAITAAGFTPRDYILTTMTYMQATMQVAAAPYTKGKPLPANMNPANVSFVQTHKAEIDALGLDKVMNDSGDEP